MKNSVLRHFAIVLMLVTFFYACSNNNDDIENTDVNNNDITDEVLTDADEVALLFMLEEEKLARDTYAYLYNLWSIKQFANIKKSEQTHMNAIEDLLVKYNLAYAILPDGVFNNKDLQDLYNQFVINGAIDKVNAFKIGATIEDLDIVDLQTLINNTKTTSIISVFKNLQCGSRNHLRSFITGLKNAGGTYTPQFLTQAEYDAILLEDNEKCNQ
jgi:hypothetical protein